MDSQQTPRPPIDLAAAQNAASVKTGGPAPVGFPPTNNNGPLDGPPRFPQQFPGPRPPYGPQRAPVPRHPFFGRPPQPGQRFPPPRPPPAGYGPQGFPLGPPRPPFPPVGDPRFARPQLPPQHPALLRRQPSLAESRMAEVEQVRPASVLELHSDKVDEAKPKDDDSDGSDEENKEPAKSKTASRAQSATTTAAEVVNLDTPSAAAPKTPSSETSSIKGFDEGRRKSLTSPSPAKSPPPATSSSPAKSLPPAMTSTPMKSPPPVKSPPPPPATISSPAKSPPVTKKPSPPAMTSTPEKSPPPAKSPPPPPATILSPAKSSPVEKKPPPAKSPTQPDAKPASKIEHQSNSSPTHPDRAAPVAAVVAHATATNHQAQDRVKATPAKLDNAQLKLPIKKSTSARSIKQDAEHDSGVDESTQRREAPKSNGVSSRTPSKTRDADKKSAAGSPIKSPNKSIRSLPRTPDAAPPTAEKKKVPMNKVQVGAAPSPNLKAVRSKIGSLENTTHKPGGGKIKIENRKLDFSSAQPKIAAKNDKYTPSGGDKKIEQVKLQWNAKPKIGSLDNTTYKPGGGNKKIESVKLDFKDKAKSKVGSKENAKHVPGGGSVKSSATTPKAPQDNNVNIESQKLDFKAESKVGSMDNMKHRPGGGDKKIFDDKSYLRQTSSNVGSVSGSGSQVTPRRPNSLIGLSPDDKRSSFDAPEPPPSTPTGSRKPISPSTPITPGSVRTGFVKTPGTPTPSGKKSLPGSPRKNISTKELQLPKLVASNPDNHATETHKTKQTRVTLPNL